MLASAGLPGLEVMILVIRYIRLNDKNMCLSAESAKLVTHAGMLVVGSAPLGD